VDGPSRPHTSRTSSYSSFTHANAHRLCSDNDFKCRLSILNKVMLQFRYSSNIYFCDCSKHIVLISVYCRSTFFMLIVTITDFTSFKYLERRPITAILGLISIFICKQNSTLTTHLKHQFNTNNATYEAGERGARGRGLELPGLACLVVSAGPLSWLGLQPVSCNKLTR
jgi:hypothetical protein